MFTIIIIIISYLQTTTNTELGYDTSIEWIHAQANERIYIVTRKASHLQKKFLGNFIKVCTSAA